MRNRARASRRWGALGAGLLVLAAAGVVQAGLVSAAPQDDVAPPLVKCVIDSDPTGLLVRVDRGQYVAPAVFRWRVGSWHVVSVPSPQGEDPRLTYYRFERWSDGGAQTHWVRVPREGLKLVAAFSTWHSFRARPEPREGGRVDLDPEPVGGYYKHGTIVTMTAVPAKGYKFLRWQRVNPPGKT